MQARLNCTIQKINSIINKKEEIYNRYFEELSGLKDIKMTRIPENINPVHFYKYFYQ